MLVKCNVSVNNQKQSQKIGFLTVCDILILVTYQWYNILVIHLSRKCRETITKRLIETGLCQCVVEKVSIFLKQINCITIKKWYIYYEYIHISIVVINYRDIDMHGYASKIIGTGNDNDFRGTSFAICALVFPITIAHQCM